MNTNRILYYVKFFFIWTLAIYFCILFFSGLYLILNFISGDAQQDDFFKIIYCHVPCAWLSFILYSVMLFLAIATLIKKNPLYYLLIDILNHLAIIYSTLTLISGSLWAKPIWGSYWVWDSRLTTMFLFTLITLLIHFSKSPKVKLALIILGSINMPIIKYSVDWWNSLHQPSTFQNFSIDLEMYIPIILIFLSFLVLAILNSLIEFRIIVLKNKIIRLGQT